MTAAAGCPKGNKSKVNTQALKSLAELDATLSNMEIPKGAQSLAQSKAKTVSNDETSLFWRRKKKKKSSNKKGSKPSSTTNKAKVHRVNGKRVVSKKGYYCVTKRRWRQIQR
jgi:hypothetical protein